MIAYAPLRVLHIAICGTWAICSTQKVTHVTRQVLQISLSLFSAPGSCCDHFVPLKQHRHEDELFLSRGSCLSAVWSYNLFFRFLGQPCSSSLCASASGRPAVRPSVRPSVRLSHAHLQENFQAAVGRIPELESDPGFFCWSSSFCLPPAQGRACVIGKELIVITISEPS